MRDLMYEKCDATIFIKSDYRNRVHEKCHVFYNTDTNMIEVFEIENKYTYYYALNDILRMSMRRCD